jgi:hypothetical protein
VRVFIANFGQENYLWPTCLAEHTIATLEAEDERPFRLAGDREGYINLVTGTKSTARGITPTRQVASRWFNLAGIIEESAGDLWIHREKDDVWWTTSRAGALRDHREPAHHDSTTLVHILQKPADAWSNRTRTGTPLRWRALHPKAQTFLFTESTLQQLAPENAAYAHALINGDTLEAWHQQPEWQAKAERVQRNHVSILDARQAAIAYMILQAHETAKRANGQQVLRTVKNKDVRFRNTPEFEAHLDLLLRRQEGRCALTDIPLEYPGTADDPELVCSLDRIDSNGHYEPGNLQIVCKFANRWKNDDSDANFRRLLTIAITNQ